MKLFLILFCFSFKSVFLAQNKELDISELILNSTIRIACDKGDTLIKRRIGNIDTLIKEKIITSGTGFFFTFKIDSIFIPTIVTNRHVVSGAYKGTLRFTSMKDEKPKYGKSISKSFLGFENMWFNHPTCDLAILPIYYIIEDLQREKKDSIYYVPFSSDQVLIQKDLNELMAIENIIMIGYPKGYMDEYNNLPITRRGITATSPYIDYNGKKEFLIDAPTFTGSSGSPVLIFDTGTYPAKGGGFAIGPRLILLGINKELVQNVGGTYPLNLGKVIKAEELYGFNDILRDWLIRNLKKNKH